jgi:hypothetical protein
MKALFWTLFSWVAWGQPAIELAGNKCEGAAVASVRSFVVGSSSHCGGGLDR